MQIDLTLSFDQFKWICYHKKARFEADSLEDLDLQIKKYLSDTTNSKRVEARFLFDFDKFPTWMRQYMPHYFNKNIIYNL